MKKILILCSLLLGSTYTMTRAEIEDIAFGVSTGLTVSRFNNSEIESVRKQPRFGFHVQAFGAYQLNEYLDAAFTVGYSAKGNRMSAKGDVHKEYQQNFDYLQTTTQLNIYPGKDRQFFFVTGGYVGYLLAAKEHRIKYVNNQKQGESKTLDLKKGLENKDNKLNNLDFGIVVGWGYEFEIGLIFKAISELGIRKITNSDRDDTPCNLSGNISLGYNFARLLE